MASAGSNKYAEKMIEWSLFKNSIKTRYKTQTYEQIQ